MKRVSPSIDVGPVKQKSKLQQSTLKAENKQLILSRVDRGGTKRSPKCVVYFFRDPLDKELSKSTIEWVVFDHRDVLELQEKHKYLISGRYSHKVSKVHGSQSTFVWNGNVDTLAVRECDSLQEYAGCVFVWLCS